MAGVHRFTGKKYPLKHSLEVKPCDTTFHARGRTNTKGDKEIETSTPGVGAGDSPLDTGTTREISPINGDISGFNPGWLNML